MYASDETRDTPGQLRTLRVPVGRLQGLRANFVLPVVAGTARPVARREQAVPLHRGRLRPAVRLQHGAREARQRAFRPGGRRCQRTGTAKEPRRCHGKDVAEEREETQIPEAALVRCVMC